MNVVGKVGSFITQGVYSVATPFHPFGGAVDIVVVQQHDSSFRSTPWYVRFGKFQGVLKGAEKVVKIEVNGVEADFHMYLDNSGEAYFVREAEAISDKENKLNDSIEGQRVDSKDEGSESGDCELPMCDQRVTLDTETDNSRLYEFHDEESSVESSEYSSGPYDNLDGHVLESQASSEVILVSVDGHVLTAPITLTEKNNENLQLSTPQFHLGPGETDLDTSEASWPDDYLSDLDASPRDVCNKVPELCEEEILHHEKVPEIEDKVNKEGDVENKSDGIKRNDVFKSCLELSELNPNHRETDPSSKNQEIVESKEEESLGSPKLTDEAENICPENTDGQCFSCSDLPDSIASPYLEAEVETNEENSLDTELNGSKESEDQQIDGLLAAEAVRNGQEEDVPETECSKTENSEPQATSSIEYVSDSSSSLEISLCKNLLRAGMGGKAAAEAFDANRVPEDKYKTSAASIIKNENLVVRIRGKYFPWEKAAPVLLGIVAYGLDLTVETNDAILVEDEHMAKPKDDGSGTPSTPAGRRWRLWSIPFRRVKTTLEHTNSNSSAEEVFVDTEPGSLSQSAEPSPSTGGESEFPHKQMVRTNLPTSDQIASLNLKDGQNMVTFIFSTRVLGVQKVDAHIYLWKWNARIVISDVDGTITKSDVLGQVMPLMGKDWTHSGIARLFSAIKENGYQLLFLSARAIVQAYLTKSFLFNLKQDGKNLPTGPVVISPDGLFPSLYREVIRRAPHEFKIACLEDIKALFPPDYNPFYAGFGNRDTDELSYRKIGIPKGKIFIINPKGEVAINNRIDVKSYTSLHTLVNDMFPPTSLVEQLVQEDYNSWNFWKMPIPDIDDL